MFGAMVKPLASCKVVIFYVVVLKEINLFCKFLKLEKTVLLTIFAVQLFMLFTHSPHFWNICSSQIAPFILTNLYRYIP